MADVAIEHARFRQLQEARRSTLDASANDPTPNVRRFPSFVPRPRHERHPLESDTAEAARRELLAAQGRERAEQAGRAMLRTGVALAATQSEDEKRRRQYETNRKKVETWHRTMEPLDRAEYNALWAVFTGAGTIPSLFALAHLLVRKCGQMYETLVNRDLTFKPFGFKPLITMRQKFEAGQVVLFILIVGTTVFFAGMAILWMNGNRGEALCILPKELQGFWMKIYGFFKCD